MNGADKKVIYNLLNMVSDFTHSTVGCQVRFVLPRGNVPESSELNLPAFLERIGETIEDPVDDPGREFYNQKIRST
jgi:hypothetical protein